MLGGPGDPGHYMQSKANVRPKPVLYRRAYVNVRKRDLESAATTPDMVNDHRSEKKQVSA